MSIDAVTLDPASEHLEVLVGSCNRDPSVQVEESDTEIVLTAYAARRVGPSGSDACQDLVRVVLGEPVGERDVVDGAGGAVPVNGSAISVAPVGP